MKIAIDKGVLSNALSTVSEAAPIGKSTMPVLEGVLLSAEKGKLQLTCNNLETAIRHTVDCEVLEPGSIVANTKLFSDIIRKMPDEEIDIITNEKEMVIEAGKTVMKIPVTSAIGFPSMPEIQSINSFEMDQQALKDMVSKVAFAADRTGTYGKISLTGIFIDVSDGVMNAVAIDGASMAIRKNETTAENVNILVLARVLEIVSRILDAGKIKVNMSSNQALFETDSLKISIPLLGCEYITYKKMIPEQYKTTAKVKTRELQSAIERSLLVFDNTREVTKPLLLTTTANGIKMFFEGPTGQSNDEVLCEISGENTRAGFDPRRLNDCLRHIEDKEVMVNLMGDNLPCIFLPVDGDKFLYFISPVRVK